jgi:hypothetical protein
MLRLPRLPRRRSPLLPAVSAVALAVAAVLSPAACSSSGSPAVATSQEGGAGDAAVGSGPVAHFVLGDGTAAPNYLDVPFPSDAYLSNGAVVTLPGLGNFIPQDTSYISYGLTKLNGFSRIALSVFAVDNPGADAGGALVASAVIDPTTLPVAETDCTTATSSVYLVDLAPGASPAVLPCRAGFHDDAPRSSTTPVVAVGPARGVVLAEGHPYAAVLTSRVKDTSGRPVAASSDFAAVAAGKAPGAVGATYMSAYTAAKAALASLLSGDGATIVSIAPYTTMKKSGEIFTMRAALETATAPTLSWDAPTMAPMGAVKFAAVASAQTGDGGADDAGGTDAAAGDAGSADGGTTGPGTLPAGFTASLDDLFGVDTSPKLPDGTDDPDTNLPVYAHDKIAALGTAVFSATSYLQVKPGGYIDPDHATFAYDANGNPVAQTNVKIWISFAIPTTPMPAGGYPAVIVQHGLDGSREFMMAIANTFTKNGWLVAAIDSVTFGARAPEASNTVDTANDFASAGSTYSGPDGFADTENGSTDLFGNLESILAIRDQFREAGFDTAQVVKLLRSNPDLSPLDTGSGAPQIDPARVAYVGDSLGAMEGTIAASIEPRVAAWFLNVNSGSIFPDLVPHSPSIAPLLSEAAAFNFGLTGDVYSWSHPLLQLLENIMEPGDPITYVHYLSYPQAVAGISTARNAVQTEVIWDEIVTDEGSEAMARAGGWSFATPNVGSNAGITDLNDIANNPGATPIPSATEDTDGTFHDIPVSGSTALVIQMGPAEHGTDLVSSVGVQQFQEPFAIPPFVKYGTPVSFPQDYRGIQNVAIRFFTDAFQGGAAPHVIGPDAGGFAPPVRDFFDGGT